MTSSHQKSTRNASDLSDIILDDCSKIVSGIDFTPLRGKTVLLTGSNGFLGRYIVYTIYLANKIKKIHCHLYCASLHAPNKDIEAISKMDKLIKPMIVDLSRDFKLTKKVDFIFHAAGYGQPRKFLGNKTSTVSTNVLATMKLLETAKKFGSRFLFFSAAETYGDVPKKYLPVKEDYNGNVSTQDERAVYRESKRLGETILSMYRKDFGVRTYIARISHIYGPGNPRDDKRVLSEFIRKAFTEGRIELMDTGKSVKTWGYIGDITKMLFNIIFFGNQSVYNVGGTDTLSIRKLAEKIGMIAGVPVVIPEKDSTLSHIGSDPSIIKLSLTRYIEEFGDPISTGITEGLKRTVDWTKSEYYL